MYLFNNTYVYKYEVGTRMTTESLAFALWQVGSVHLPLESDGLWLLDHLQHRSRAAGMLKQSPGPGLAILAAATSAVLECSLL
jgi:hypothetical protein